MSWLQNKIVKRILIGIIAAAAGWTTAKTLTLRDKVYEYKGITFTIPAEIITGGTNQVALWKIKFEQMVDKL